MNEFVIRKGVIFETPNASGSLNLSGSLLVTGSIQTSNIDFDTTSINSNKPGRLRFDSSSNSLSYNPITSNNDVTINLGQESVTRIYNDTGNILLNGQCVYISGSYNDVATVSLSCASCTSSNFLVSGVVTHNIGIGEYGFITYFGEVHELDLSNYQIGDILYLSDTVPGGYVTLDQLAITSRTSELGYVLNNSSTIGVLHVRIYNEFGVTSIPSRLSNILTGNNVSSGIYDFNGTIINSGSNTFNITSASGWIVDNTTEPNNPTVTNIQFNGLISGSTIYRTTDINTYLLINSSSLIISQSSFPTPVQRRDNIFLGHVVHADKLNITTAINNPDIEIGPLSQLRDMFRPIKYINDSIVPFPLSGMTFQTTAGSLYGLGINWVNDNKNPNKLLIPAKNPATFQYRTQSSGSSYTDITSIDATHYDLNGIVTSFSSGATNQRIYLLPSGFIRIQYGQQVYGTITTALAGLQSEMFVINQSFIDNAQLIGVLTVRHDANDLTDTTDGRFIPVSKFGELTGGTAGISTTTLQQAYDNSTNPEIVTNSTLDGVQFRGGTGVDSDKNIIIENNVGNQTSWFTAAGNLYTQNITGSNAYLSGSLNVQNGVTGSTDFNTIVNKPTLISSSAQLATEISGAFNSTSSSISDDIIILQLTQSSFITGDLFVSSSRYSISSSYAPDNTVLLSSQIGVGSDINMVSGSNDLTWENNSLHVTGSANITGIITTNLQQVSTQNFAIAMAVAL